MKPSSSYIEKIDLITGEVTCSDLHTLKYSTQDEFIQDYIYLHIMNTIKLTKAEHAILAMCKMHSGPIKKNSPEGMGNPISINGDFKMDIIKSCHLKVETVYKALSKFVKLGLLFRNKEYTGTYYLNPKYFFKGTSKDRTKLILAQTTYKYVDEKDITNEANKEIGGKELDA
jgi:hypothetical protein